MFQNIAAKHRRNCLVASVVLGVFVLTACQVAIGQNDNLFSNRAVGGVSIDANGILNNSQIDDLGNLSKMRNEALEKIPGDMNSLIPMRKISLRRLEEAIQDCVKNNKPLPDSIKYLAGLQRIQYVFVYPEQKDIVLVGPGEGWKVGPKGDIVGMTTGRPVMLLDDLLVALRTAKAAQQSGINCSIDPTPEGLARLNGVKADLIKTGDAKTVAAEMEKALGLQQITVQGVPGTSHFARVLVAADYRMKRIGMHFDPSPVRGLTSYLQMLKPGPNSNASQRFWLEPKYEALLRDADGLAFEFQGSGVKAMTEEDFVAAGGKIQHSGKSGSPIAKKWAETMTEKYPELAVADPIFGQLQNCMELAVVGALIVKDRLPEKAGYSMAALLDPSAVKTVAFNEPKQTPTIASILGKGRKPVISASGGVSIDSWVIAGNTLPSDKVDPVRAKSVPAEKTEWWWN